MAVAICPECVKRENPISFSYLYLIHTIVAFGIRVTCIKFQRKLIVPLV